MNRPAYDRHVEESYVRSLLRHPSRSQQSTPTMVIVLRDREVAWNPDGFMFMGPGRVIYALGPDDTVLAKFITPEDLDVSSSPGDSRH